MNNQPDEGPMNHIASLLEQANYPKQAIISIGATRYTEFGETHFLQPNDLSIVVVYNGEKYSAEEIEKMARDEKFADDDFSAYSESGLNIYIKVRLIFNRTFFLLSS